MVTFNPPRTVFISFIFLLAINAYSNTSKTGMRSMSSFEIVADMGVGWNLGNTFDSECEGIDAETCWENPVTTKAMIDEIASRGFKTMRLPVTWEGHMGDAPDYTIDEEWLSRVEEVANYAFANDMYVILNIHHEKWITPTYAELDSVSDRIGKVWTQIANHFIEYSDFLIFETMNEPRHIGSELEWQGGTAEGRDCINQLHKAAVDAIRSTGRNNRSRHLMICPYAASSNNNTMADLFIPNDDPNTIVSIHSYFPWLFCLVDETDWGTAEQKLQMDAEFNRIYDAFIAQGHPVVMGEWGATNNNNLNDRLAHASYYVQKCKEKGICPVWWDNGKASEFAVFDRQNIDWHFPTIADTILHEYEYKKCTEAEHVTYISVNGSEYINSTYAMVRQGDEVSVKVEYSFGNTAVWTLPDGNSVQSNEMIFTDFQFADAGTYEYQPLDESMCNSSTPVNLNIDVYQAEDFINQEGIQTELTTDDGGGENIGYIQNGDWSSYSITVEKTGIYKLYTRVATGTTGGVIDFSIEGESLATVNVDGALSDGWQDWYTTEPVEIVLEEGTHELTLTYTGSDGFLFNVNWFDLQFSQHIQYLELKEGWNLVSLSIQPNNSLTGTVFQNAEVVKTFDSFYNASQPDFMNSLQKIIAGEGYLVYNSVDETISIQGDTVEPHSQASLQDGWNLIGVSFSEPTFLEDAFDNELQNIQIIKDFSGFWEAGGYFNTIEILEQGNAYFVKK